MTSICISKLNYVWAILVKMIILISLLSSCVTAKFPLCPKLSKTDPSSITYVNKKLFDICKARKISITVLSPTIVELKASYKQIKWLQNNYHIILCEFDQTKIPNDSQVYTTCMLNARNWIKIVQGRNPGILMLDSTHFCSVCCE